MKALQKFLTLGISVFLLGLGLLACQSLTESEKVSAMSTGQTTENVIVTQGNAVVSGKAETAILSLGVTTQNASAAEASKENAKKMNAVIEALKKAGVKEDAMSTSDFSIYPEYDYNADYDKIKGYRVSNQITVKLEEIDKVASCLDTAIAAGANNVNHVSFGMKDGKSQYDQALEAAVGNARAKAELLAKAAGIKGKLVVLSIKEIPSYDTPYLKTRDMNVEASMAGGTTLMPGEQDVTAEVEVVFTYN